jgi:hypothetical protein
MLSRVSFFDSTTDNKRLNLTEIIVEIIDDILFHLRKTLKENSQRLSHNNHNCISIDNFLATIMNEIMISNQFQVIFIFIFIDCK